MTRFQSSSTMLTFCFITWEICIDHRQICIKSKPIPKHHKNQSIKDFQGNRQNKQIKNGPVGMRGICVFYQWHHKRQTDISQQTDELHSPNGRIQDEDCINIIILKISTHLLPVTHHCQLLHNQFTNYTFNSVCISPQKPVILVRQKPQKV